MSTATVEQIPAPTSQAPAEPSLATALYGPDPEAKAEPSVANTPAQTQDTEPAPANKPDASPPAPAKEEPPKAPEDKDQLKEQLDRQTAANKRLGRENAEFRQQLLEVNRKLDELTARANGEEPPKAPQPTEAQIRAEENFRGRDLASKPVAFGMYGEDEVLDQVYGREEGEVTPFVQLAQEKPWIYLEVRRHPQPAVAAMHALKRESFIKKYGDDPTKWEEKIVASVKPKLFEEFQKQYTTPPVGSPVPSVSEARNAGGGTSQREKTLADALYPNMKD